MSGLTVDHNEELLREWNKETNFDKRNTILQKMTDRGLFPKEEEEEYEKEAGLYPNLPDPQAKLYNRNFIQKLLRKQEFYESRQDSIQDMFESDDQDLLTLLESDASVCGAYVEGKEETNEDEPTMTPFELSPTQRFIGRFLSPRSPYNSALLFHGVGVGKTCSGITVAENFLEMYPRKQVYIIAPPTIQAGWLREIFNFKKLILSKKPGVPNIHTGCTGNTYLRLTSTEYEKDIEIIKKKINELIKARYKIVGYLQFYNYVVKYLDRNISSGLDSKIRQQQEMKYLDLKFSSSLIIVDEAHNLRDTETEVVEIKTIPKPPPVPQTLKRETKPEETKEEVYFGDDEEDDEEEEDENENEGISLEEMEGGANDNQSYNNNYDDDDDNEGIVLEPMGELRSTAPVKVEVEDFKGEEKDTPVTEEDKQDIIKGKKVTPLLKNKILPAAVGMKFLMLTATPMYNDYTEIILLLNLLLINDKRATIRQSQIFTDKGDFVPGGKELLGRIANSYVSFMRGENPLSFPIRLNPKTDDSYSLPIWPEKDPLGGEIDMTVREQIVNLPFVSCDMNEEVVSEFQKYAADLIKKEGFSIPTTDKLIMAGNFLYPSTSDNFSQQIGKRGFDGAFQRLKGGIFKPLSQDINGKTLTEEWMFNKMSLGDKVVSPLSYYSPKAKYLLDRIQTTEGVSFVYSRFVETGALTLALILEANGYTCASRKKPLLAPDATIHPDGRICALCSLHENYHVDHEFEPKSFQPAYYVLLTGEKEYSPNNKTAIELATDTSNYTGKNVKVILGSTIASEGIDLKFIRELFVFDSWYHLSKLEQVIGRGIRYKSHCALEPLKRNCTINLLVLSYGPEYDQETIDMFQYRRGFLKAKQVGQVTRVLKEYAVDCNLNKELILIQGLGKITQIDGQGERRENEVDVNDTPYTNICDWLETCDYTCKPDIDLDALEIDETSYDEYAAKWREHKIKKILRKVFEEQPWHTFDNLENKILQYIPRVAKASILDDIVNNRAFRIRVGNQEGYIIYKNGFYLFQPEMLWDENLPIALRLTDFPVKRDFYEPLGFVKDEPVEPMKGVKKNAPKKNNGKKANEEVVGETKEEEVVAEEEEEEEEEEEDRSQFDAFWLATVEWSKTIEAGTSGKDTPKTINTILDSRYLDLGEKTVTSIKNVFEMVGYLYFSVRTNPALRKLVADCLLEFVWDEYLYPSEIQRLYKKYEGTPQMKVASAENTLVYGSTKIFRYLNPKTNTLVYICGEKVCDVSIVEGAEQNDPISKLVANRNTTGELYGLNGVKSEKITFKSNDAAPVGEVPANGRLCYSVPNKEPHLKMLGKIAETAVATTGSNLDLTSDKIKAVKTPYRLCTLADLSLRLLDKVRPDGKRYFYRPIAAIKSKHTSKGSK
jgi:hypothetical protein